MRKALYCASPLCLQGGMTLKKRLRQMDCMGPPLCLQECLHCPWCSARLCTPVAALLVIAVMQLTLAEPKIGFHALNH